MTITFKHKGLRSFYNSGSVRGIHPEHAKKLRSILARLDASQTEKDMDLPGLHPHKLKGIRKDIWPVRVSGNWRITFRFVGRDVEIVNYEDYH